MTIECPAAGCRHRFSDRDRASLVRPASGDTSSVEINLQQQSATSCPECGTSIELGLLMLDDDGVWRISRYAGHSHDVTVMRPPGGSVSYAAPRREEPAPPAGLSPGDVRIRERALAVIAGKAGSISRGLQREALELALEVGVLEEPEAEAARARLGR